MNKTLIALILLAGCAGSDDRTYSADPDQTVGTSEETADVLAQVPMPGPAWCAEHRCVANELTFAPEPNAQLLAEKMTERYSAATGLDIRTDQAGIPVVFAEDLVNKDGSRPCARTEWSGMDNGPMLVQRIVMDPSPWDGPDGNCPGLMQTLMHEAIHAMAPKSEHTPSGLYAKKSSGTGKIDSDALAALCGFVPCAAFNPED